MLKKIYLILFTVFLMFIATSSTLFAEPINVKLVSIDEYQSNINQTTLIDVRTINSREKSKMEVPGSTWIDPYSGPALENFVKSADKNSSYTIFCSCIDDNYSIRTAQILTKKGFQNVAVIKNGWDSITKSNIKLSPIKFGGTK